MLCYKVAALMGNAIMLFETGFGLVVNVYCDIQDNHYPTVKRSRADMLKGKRKQNCVKCEVKTREDGEKVQRTRAMSSKQKHSRREPNYMSNHSEYEYFK